MPDKNTTNTSESTYVLLSDIPKPSHGFKPPWYYRLAIKVLKPLYRVALWRRHKKAKKLGLPIADYKQEIDVRFGREYPDSPELPAAKLSLIEDNPFKDSTIWCHAVSLGETNTIAPMLTNMLEQGAKIWLTNTTQTGYARAEKLFTNVISSKQMVHTFVPVDDKEVIEKFITHVQPDLAMFVETELWANSLAVLSGNDIPSVLVNARLSQKSFEGYAKYEAISKSMMHNITMIIAQDADSAIRFRRLGTDVPKIRRADSLKWSTSPINISNSSTSERTKHLDAIKTKFCTQAEVLNRPVWVAGSTHEGEERLLLQAHKQLIDISGLTDTLLIIVPRHPERFDAVAQLIDQSGLSYQRRSLGQLIEPATQVYLADTMGELIDCYELADVTFVGGSLVNIGGHNPVEAASLAKPIIMGVYTQSCQELVTALEEVGALKVVESSQDLPSKNKTNKVKTNKDKTNKDKTNKDKRAIKRLNNDVDSSSNSLTEAIEFWLRYPDIAQQAGEQGKSLVAEKSSAMQKQMEMVEALLLDHLRPQTINDPTLEEVDLDHFKVRSYANDSHSSNKINDQINHKAKENSLNKNSNNSYHCVNSYNSYNSYNKEDKGSLP